MVPADFVAIPDWFSWENQGCDLAAVRLGGATGLIVFLIDAPPGQNRGLYRFGTGLDSVTAAAGSWGPWQDIPDWFPWENADGGVACADVTGNGRPDLIVLMVDSPQGQNAGYYRVGRDLSDQGVVTVGWTPLIPIPDWFSWENQGAGIAVADLDGSGDLDLVIFMIDDAVEQNRGLFRVGRGLAADGGVKEWTPWIDVPDWFSWTNAGGGVALAEATAGAGFDLAVFGIDNPPGPVPPPSGVPSGQNQVYFRLGRGLRSDGTVSGWSSLLGVNNWFSWDNQYGGLTVVGPPGQAQLLLAATDSPPGQNAGFYTSLTLTETPATHGQWEVLPFLSGVLAIHAATLHTGKVLFFAGTGNNPVRDAAPDFGDVAKGLWTSVVWDHAAPDGSNFAHPATIARDNGRPFDFFCGGDTFDADGRVFSAGGNLAYNHGNNLGQKETALFDPATEQWSRRASMKVGRWYPTLLTLADGRILAVSGKNDTTGELNRHIEIYDVAADAWQPLTEPQGGFAGLPFYAHLFLMADGRIFFSGGRMDDGSPLPAGILDLTSTPVGFQPIASMVTPAMRNQSSSVLLPPAQDQKVMIIGGGPEDETTTATGCTEQISLAAGPNTFHLAMPLSLPRMHLNAVLLPDRTVLVSGGAIKHEAEKQKPVPRLQAEIYHPDTDTWTPAATAAVSRMYHSVALLLPDGTVVTACGNPPPYGNQVPWMEQPNEELKLEIFRPPYLFAGPRPPLPSAQAEWHYGTTVTIDTPDPSAILWAELIRPGVTTHAFDNAQRLIDLPITARAAGDLSVATPPTATLAPPGWYMLFLIDRGRIPSDAAWIHLG